MKLSDIQTGTFLLSMGMPSSGKTSAMRNLILKHKYEEVLVLTNEPRQLRVLGKWGIEDINVKCLTSYNEWEEALRTVPTEVKYLIVDSLTALHDMLFQYVKKHKSYKDNRKVYGDTAEMFIELVYMLKGLADHGLNVVCIVHKKYKTVNKAGYSEPVDIEIPDLPGQLPNWLGRTVDAAIRHHVLKQGSKRVYECCTSPDEDNLGKDWTGYLKEYEPNDFKVILDKLSKRSPKKRKKKKPPPKEGTVEVEGPIPINSTVDAEGPQKNDSNRMLKGHAKRQSTVPLDGLVSKENTPSSEGHAFQDSDAIDNGAADIDGNENIECLREEVLSAGINAGQGIDMTKMYASSKMGKCWDDLTMEELNVLMEELTEGDKE